MVLISLRLLSVVLLLFSTSFLPPLLLSYFYQDGLSYDYWLTISITLLLALLCKFFSAQHNREVRTRDGFFIVALLWTVLSLLGALPIYLAKIPGVFFVDAAFESVSGLTTTGSTVLSALDKLPPSLLYYRQQLQFLGGMGIILLAVAVLPMLGIGGMQLFRAETTGPVKDNKLTPRITETAKALWFIYCGLTAACAFIFWLLGMSFFDAVNFAFATVSTGGYAPHDASMGYYSSSWISIVAVIFMTLGSINFSLHFLAFQRQGFSHYFKDSEVRLFLNITLTVFLLSFFVLSYYGVYDSSTETAVEALFHIVSMLSTTGLTSSDFSQWPSFLPYLILLIGLIGGCAGSTSGGVKIVRVVLLFKQGYREIRRLMHPNGKFLVKMNNKAVPYRVIDAVWGYLAAYFVVFMLIVLLLVANHLDFNSAFSATIACLANVGPGLGSVATNFYDISDNAKWILSFTMLLGRLEIFTVLILFTPTFWQS